MKALIGFLFPTFKAFVSVMVFLFTLVSVSYGGIVLIAKSEAKNIESKILAVRNADMQHMDKRFDRIEKLIKEEKK